MDGLSAFSAYRVNKTKKVAKSDKTKKPRGRPVKHFNGNTSPNKPQHNKSAGDEIRPNKHRKINKVAPVTNGIAHTNPELQINGNPLQSESENLAEPAPESTTNKNATKKATSSKAAGKRKLPSPEATKPKGAKKNKQTTKPDKKDKNSSERISTPNVKSEPQTPSMDYPLRNDSVRDGKMFLTWLLDPVSIDDFFEKFWEKAPCLIIRDKANYFSKLLSFQAIDEMLLQNHVEFTKNLDITSYKNGERETLNPEGRALPPAVWDFYSNGCSIRLLNPQTFLQPIYVMNATLQEFFHCMVGANVYLTPPNSQGFAPHYDDIEAFVLQIEGRKRWKLYNPRSHDEVLPRFSSENFKEDEIGEPIVDEVLNPGDVLYFPRGTIHQACTEPGVHSLHITLSVYQRQSFADLMEKMFPMMLQRAIQQNVELRRGLPLETWRNGGIAYCDDEQQSRQNFLETCQKLVSSIVSDLPIDEAVDQLAKKFYHEALPAAVTQQEKIRTIFGSSTTTNPKGEAVKDFDISLTSKVRMLRANIARLVQEDGKTNLYYYLDNSKQYCEYEPNYLEVDLDDAASIEVLIKSYPGYVTVRHLPHDDGDEPKLAIVRSLWERGLLMVDKPLQTQTAP